MLFLKQVIRRFLGRQSLHLINLYYCCRYVLFYLGDRHRCPCCGAALRKFMPLIPLYGGPVAGVICPRCDSHPRHRLLWLFFQYEKKDVFDHNPAVLHIAPEFALMRQLLKIPNLHYISADLNSPFADCRVDVCMLPFINNIFDLVLCNHVLEHVPDDRRAMGELFRVLKPGGLAVVQVPVGKGLVVTLENAEISTPEARTRFFGQHDHVRLYGEDYPIRLAQAGFTVTISNFIDSFDAEAIKRYGLDKEEKLFLCSKVDSAATSTQDRS